MYVALVGDIQGSKLFPDQKSLFTGLQEQFDWVNSHVTAVQKLRFTVGDEFQAAYETVLAAFKAVIFLRLKFKVAKLEFEHESPGLARNQEVRFGLAYGRISVFPDKSEPYGQSGEAWWEAREAIEEAESPKNQRQVPYSMQTRFRGLTPSMAAMTNSFWLAMDQVLYRMDRTDAEIALGSLTGLKQTEIAQQLNLSQPVVSRRSKRNGIFTVLRILDELEGLAI